MSKIIDLSEFFVRLRADEQRVTAAEQEFRKAEQNLGSCRSQIREELTKRLAEGETTGHALQDEIISIFGLAKDIIRSLLEFSKFLEANKDKKCSLAIPWQRQIRHRLIGGGGDDDFVSDTGYILGVLSGGRLKLVRRELPFFSIVMPFTKYATTSLPFHQKDEMKEGEYVVGGPDRPFFPEVPEVLGAITDPDKSPVKIIVGVAAGFHCQDLERLLDLPSEAEKIAGGGI